MNWLSVSSNALWIFALAWAIALLGNAYWKSFESKEPFRIILARPKQRGSLILALMVFCMGLGLVLVPIWGKVLWFALALVSLITAWSFFRWEHKQRKSSIDKVK